MGSHIGTLQAGCLQVELACAKISLPVMMPLRLRSASVLSCSLARADTLDSCHCLKVCRRESTQLDALPVQGLCVVLYMSQPSIGPESHLEGLQTGQQPSSGPVVQCVKAFTSHCSAQTGPSV